MRYTSKGVTRCMFPYAAFAYGCFYKSYEFAMTRRPSTKTAAKELGERLRREGEELHLT